MPIPAWLAAISKAIPIIQAVSTVVLPNLRANPDVPQGVKEAVEDLLEITQDLKEAIEKNGQRITELEKENRYLKTIAFVAVGASGFSLFLALYILLSR